MKNIEIDRNGKLFKLFLMLSKLPMFSIFIKVRNTYKIDWTDEINSFNDICTFVRHIMLSLFFAIPILLVSMCVLLGGAFYLIIYLPISLLFGGSIYSDNYINPALFIMIGELVIVLTYFILLWLQTAANNRRIDMDKLYYDDPVEYVRRRDAKRTEKESDKEPGVLRQIFNMLSQKHSQMCKRITYKNDSSDIK